MALTLGTRLGVYEVTAQVGEGGMGQVYRARDTRLDRDVAIKILPEAFAHDADRLARFQREAKTLASLNHPNIAIIHGLEQAGDVHALVMELVEGEDLSQRLARGAIPIDEALPIAKQIAEALEAAHEQGIIHRDLKPANIKIKNDGVVKVLDFGLAKAMEPSAGSSASMSMSPTITSPAMMTGVGVLLGTAAYMSPEQARGRRVDKRTDIFAFGCVLFEMLAGRRPFQGDDVTEILGRIVTAEPDWSRLPPGTPPRIRELLGRCLQKDPKLRLRDIGDAQFELRNAGAPASAEAVERPALRHTSLIAAGIAVGLMAIAFMAGSRLRNNERPSLPARLSISLPDGHRVTSGPIITRDGSRIAFVSTEGTQPPMLYTRRLDSFELRAIPGSEDADKPFFSPDGRWIAYFAKGQLFKVDLEGAAPVALAEAPLAITAGTWAEDGTIVFAPTWNGGLYRIGADGGRATLLIRPDAANKEYALVWPYFLPGGKELLFAEWGATFSISRLTLPELTRSVVAPNFWTSAAYAASGHIVVGSSQTGDLQAVRYNSKNAGGSPISVLQRVHWSGVPGDGLFKFGVSLDGTLVYAPGDITQRSLVFVDETGEISQATAEHQPYVWFSLSPDGRKVAEIYNPEVWIIDLERGGRTALTPELGRTAGRHQPTWSPDGSRIFFSSNHEGNWDIYSKSVARPDTLNVVLKREFDQFPTSVAPDGTLAYQEARPGMGSDIWVLSPGGSPEPWLATKADEWLPRFSPDGRLIAYASNASGRYEVYVHPFRGQGERVQVSTGGGNEPTWSPTRRSSVLPGGKRHDGR